MREKRKYDKSKLKHQNTYMLFSMFMLNYNTLPCY